jgi:NADH:ubiquinone oxidoreductase subunit 4 (subunit M)
LDPDYDSLDPEVRTKRYLAIISAAFGLISIFAALLPGCGGFIGLAGVILGFLAVKSEMRKVAILGIVLSAMGMLTALGYQVLLSLR